MPKKAPHRRQRVHCRTGSLEISDRTRSREQAVHCRTGSLETAPVKDLLLSCVHCHTGSLEIDAHYVQSVKSVHCRTGSVGDTSPGMVLDRCTLPTGACHDRGLKVGFDVGGAVQRARSPFG